MDLDVARLGGRDDTLEEPRRRLRDRPGDVVERERRPRLHDLSPAPRG